MLQPLSGRQTQFTVYLDWQGFTRIPPMGQQGRTGLFVRNAGQLPFVTQPDQKRLSLRANQFAWMSQRVKPDEGRHQYNHMSSVLLLQ